MTPRNRRQSPLEDDDFSFVLEHDEDSSGDVCERCGCAREKHTEDSCECGRCEGFVE
jgi:hypothetical protein